MDEDNTLEWLKALVGDLEEPLEHYVLEVYIDG